MVEEGRFTPTEEGTPQGGVISPVLMNVALHGMEQAAGVRYRSSAVMPAQRCRALPVLVRYADDLLALCHSRQQAEQVKARLAAWLAPRGLVFNEEKTRIVHLEEGFDFLGFNVRRYRNGKLLIKPSKAAVRRIRERLTAEMRALRGANANAVIRTLNPIIRGWAAYYRSVVSSEVFAKLDNHVWKLTYKWALARHPNKPRHWVVTGTSAQFNKSRQDRWVFGDRDTGAYLVQVRLDEDRPAPAGQGHGVPRRPGPDRVLGRRRAGSRPAGQAPCACSGPAWTLPGLRGSAAARRPRATEPRGMGDVAPATRRAISMNRSPPGRPATGREGAPPRPRPLPAATAEGTAPLYACEPFGACLSRGAGKPHARF